MQSEKPQKLQRNPGFSSFSVRCGMVEADASRGKFRVGPNSDRVSTCTSASSILWGVGGLASAAYSTRNMGFVGSVTGGRTRILRLERACGWFWPTLHQIGKIRQSPTATRLLTRSPLLNLAASRHSLPVLEPHSVPGCRPGVAVVSKVGLQLFHAADTSAPRE